jgi:SAM-dependent methyltransferase
MIYDQKAADEYDDLHADRFAEAATSADLLAELAGAGPVLELGIGTGRLALPLVARGVEVHGVDSSEAMVQRLRAKPGGPDVPVVVGDFADLGSLVGGRYRLVFVAYNTLFELPTQEHQLRCMTGVAQHLVPGGALVVEAMTPDLTRLEQAVAVARADHQRVVLHASRHDPVTQQVVTQRVTITDEGVRLSPFTIRYASVPELDLMARLAGLRLRDRWAGWEREPFTATSHAHVAVYGR